MIGSCNTLMIRSAGAASASLSAQAETTEITLTPGGTLIMVVCIVLVLSLLIFCMTRILRESHPKAHHHAPLEIDTHDAD